MYAYLDDYQEFFPDHDYSFSILFEMAGMAEVYNGQGKTAMKIYEVCLPVRFRRRRHQLMNRSQTATYLQNLFHEVQNALPEDIWEVHGQEPRIDQGKIPIRLDVIKEWIQKTSKLPKAQQRGQKALLEIISYLFDTFVNAACAPLPEGWEMDTKKVSITDMVVCTSMN